MALLQLCHHGLYVLALLGPQRAVVALGHAVAEEVEAAEVQAEQTRVAQERHTFDAIGPVRVQVHQARARILVAPFALQDEQAVHQQLVP